MKERMKMAARFGPLFIAPEGVTTNGKSVVGRSDTGQDADDVSG